MNDERMNLGLKLSRLAVLEIDTEDVSPLDAIKLASHYEEQAHKNGWQREGLQAREIIDHASDRLTRPSS